MPLRTILTAVAVAALTAQLGVTSAATSGPPAASGDSRQPLRGLRVLITNDDSAQGRDTRYGTDGRGLYELRRAMCDAGADVVVVAPWQQQSGASARMVAPGLQPVPLSVTRVAVPPAYADDCSESWVARDGTGVYGVCQGQGGCAATTPTASPADAVNVALTRFVADNYWSDGPDVVLSGINFGHNVAASVNHSGTVGAVVTALEHGAPTIAFSAEVAKDLTKLAATPFADTAGFAVDLVSRLRSRELLDEGLALNVNYPFLDEGERLGKPVLTVIGDSNDVGARLDGDVGRSGGTYLLNVADPGPEGRSNADITALRANDIAVTPLDGDWGAAKPHSAIDSVLRTWARPR